MVANYSLWDHQTNIIKRALEQDTFAILADPGVGKSACGVRVLAERMNQNKRNLRAIVFAPPIVLQNWKNEFRMFSDIDQSKILVLRGSGKERLELLKKSKAHIMITNWESLLMKDLFQAMKDFKPEFLIWDESHRAKNPQAIRTKRAIELSDLAQYKLILTGTPVLQSCMDLWAQFRILDKGATFGTNFFTFRAKYFHDANAMMPAHIRFPAWKIKPRAMDEFNHILHTRGAVAKKEDCLTLPPLVIKRVDVEMGVKQKKVYDDMKRDFISFIDSNVAVAQLAITKALRMMQIVSGFVNTEEGGEIVFEDNPRIDALRAVLEEIFESGEKVLIWSVFSQNYKQIRKLLDSMKIKFVELTGETSAKQRETNVDIFNKDKDVLALIGNQGSGGIGTNLVAASYAVYFSRSFSLEHQLQSSARNYRGGSTIHKKITHINLVCPDSIDQLILERLSNKQDISNNVLRDIANELRGK